MSLSISVTESNVDYNQIISVQLVSDETLSNVINDYIVFVDNISFNPLSINTSGTTATINIQIPLSPSKSTLIVLYNDAKSNELQLNISYPDNVFDVGNNYKKPQQSIVSNNLPVNNFASYNKDIAYTSFTEVYDENSIIQNVCTIILTRKGERLFNPSFGTEIQSKIFYLVSDPIAFEKNVLDEITKSIEQYEPRAIVDKGQSSIIYNENDNSVILLLSLILPKGNVTELGLTLSIPRMEIN